MEKPDNHYKNCVIEPIDVIKKMLTHEQYKGFLLGNALKYRLRAGHKTEGDIEKAMQYEKWYLEQVSDTILCKLKYQKKKTPQEIAEECRKTEGYCATCPAIIVNNSGAPDIKIDFDCDGIYCNECPLYAMSESEIIAAYGRKIND